MLSEPRVRSRVTALTVCLGLLLMMVGGSCASVAPDNVLEQHERFGEIVELPEPATTGSGSFEELLSIRRSTRSFTDEQLDMNTIGQLFWAGQGITHDGNRRTAPSAGALYPIELYAITPETVLHYLPEGHRAELRADTSILQQLPAMAFDQEFLATAPVVFVITGVDERTAEKYGDAAESYVDIEAGHVAQNILLQATSLGLASVPVGGFEEGSVETLLVLSPGETVRYLLPVGHPDDPSG